MFAIAVAAQVPTSSHVVQIGAEVSRRDGGPCRGDDCKVKGDGASIGLSEDQTARLPKNGKATVLEGKKKVVRVVSYQYDIPAACAENKPGAANQVSCPRSVEACVPVENAVGPLVTVWRRLVLPDGKYGDWEQVGETCWPNLVPNAKQRPELTVAMIKAAFSQTPFVKPQVTMQPVGNKTLVNLPTYFAVDFSGPGYGPDKVRTVTLLGHQVRIKPVLKSNTFHFGDGSSLGPTLSRGGT